MRPCERTRSTAVRQLRFARGISCPARVDTRRFDIICTSRARECVPTRADTRRLGCSICARGACFPARRVAWRGLGVTESQKLKTTPIEEELEQVWRGFASVRYRRVPGAHRLGFICAAREARRLGYSCAARVRNTAPRALMLNLCDSVALRARGIRPCAGGGSKSGYIRDLRGVCVPAGADTQVLVLTPIRARSVSSCTRRC